MNEYLSAYDLEKQEHLSEEQLKKLEPKNDRYKNLSNRPPANFIELMNWSADSFKDELKESNNLQKFVHNRIIIDGQFLQFCQERNIKIECLMKDSIISWKTESNFEKYFAQGVFLVKGKDVEFIQNSLFAKGAQHEDEISFFVIVDKSNYSNYISLRNEFDTWVSERDRDNLHIRVIEGDDLPYTKDHTWEDLFLEESSKTEIKNLVENFLSSKDFYLKNKIPWKRGILLFGPPGCHDKGTLIMMHDKTWKNVEDIEVGEMLMGPDSQPREVLRLIRGNEKMYKITPETGKEFIVNENHILHLHYCVGKELPVNITVKEYYRLFKSISSKLKLVQYNTEKTTSIQYINVVGPKDFYGFIIDKDHLYVMDGDWITHNCGKTSLIRTIMSVYNFKPVTIAPGVNDEAVREAFSYAEEQSPALLYFEDLDSLLEKNVDISSFLNLMDGISAKNGLLVIATANEVRKLKTNITDRPSRFDRKVEISRPDENMAFSYLKKWFGELINVKKCRELAKYAVKYEFSYAFCKELYISTMFEALQHNRKSPSAADIDNALKKLVKDKNLLNQGGISMDKYFKA
jgi:hypothetical protein